MKHILSISGSLMTLYLLLSVSPVRAQQNADGFSLRKLFGISPKTEAVYINRNVDLQSLAEWSKETSRFYRNRGYHPVWFKKGKLNHNGKVLIKELKSSWAEGLPEPILYLAKVETELLNMQKRSAHRIPFEQLISEADVLLTQAYFDFASKVSSGVLRPGKLNAVWEIKPETTDLVSHLEKALEQGKIAESFSELKPDHEQYDLLLKAFHQLLNIKENGGWQLPGSFPPLRENDSHPNVIRIKKYLHDTGDLNEKQTSYLNNPIYDHKLAQAVKNFQYRHGLKQDGIAGENTLKQMNVPLDFRINQIRLNLDRIRWQPDDFGKDHIIINIPDYSFTYYKDNLEIQQMKVIVGENENYTPVLEDTLHSIIFNPSWNVPNSIATEELFPKMLHDSTFMERNNYYVLRTSYVSKDTIDINEYDWSEVPRDSFPYFIVQAPGPFNSLGQIQFMLQNQYAIYLHDTPADYLFNVAQRDFSHGCIRLEKPEQLAMVLLTDQVPTDSLLNYIAGAEKQVVYLEEKIPVHIVYQTAWMEDGNLNFREDVYDFDKLSMNFFRKSYPEMAWLLPEIEP